MNLQENIRFILKEKTDQAEDINLILKDTKL